MPFSEKVLWVVKAPNLPVFLSRAKLAGANAVAIRTDNNMVAAISLFHASGIKVYGWRWPSADPPRALAEANAAYTLIRSHGMDGYFVDPEGAPGFHYDWDRPGLGPLATQFCQRVRSADPGKPFGFTSHFRAKDVHPRLPWAEFIAQATVLLPQSYWKSTAGTIGSGDPAVNYRLGIQKWQAAGGNPAKIVPMAGEIAVTNAGRIAQYGAVAAAEGRKAVHFYTANASVSGAVWSAIAAV